MSAGVWEEIQNYEIKLCSVDYKILCIAVVGNYVAEDASGLLVDRGDVSVTPGAPDVFHNDASRRWDAMSLLPKVFELQSSARNLKRCRRQDAAHIGLCKQVE